MIAELTDTMIQRILFEGWDVACIDRQTAGNHPHALPRGPPMF